MVEGCLCHNNGVENRLKEMAMTFQKLPAGRKRSYLKHHPAKYDSHTRDLLSAHPDWIKKSEPRIEKVLDKEGREIIKHEYIPVKKIELTHKLKLFSNETRTLYMCIQGSGTAYFTEINHLINTKRQSINYGSGDMAKKMLQISGESGINWKTTKWLGE